MQKIEFTFLRQPPRKYTFDTKQIAKWVIANTQNGNLLNLFAGKTRLFDYDANVIETRIDTDPTVYPNYVMDAESFLNMAIEKGLKYNTIILDPPYNLRKSIEKYNGRYLSSFQKIKEKVCNVIEENGNIITCGYNSISMGKSRGFNVMSICLISHGGSHNDTIITNEKFIGKLWNQ